MKRFVYLRYLVAGLLWLGMVGPGHGRGLDNLQAKIELARENLRISQVTEERIAAELQALRNSGEASPEILKDYEIYLARVQAMVIENRRVLREIEATHARHLRPEEPSDSRAAREDNNTPHLKISEEEKEDELAALDRQLNESLAKFDEMLLKEIDRIRIQSAAEMTQLAEEAAAAARRLRERGVEMDTSAGGQTGAGEESSSDQGSETQEGTSGQQGKQEAGSREHDAEGATQEQGGVDPSVSESGTRQAESQAGAEGPRVQQPDRPPVSQDDDIVARQLREAAENETDPVLREKLWREYEEYKRDTAS